MMIIYVKFFKSNPKMFRSAAGRARALLIRLSAASSRQASDRARHASVGNKNTDAVPAGYARRTRGGQADRAAGRFARKAVTLHLVAEADHSFHVPAKSGRKDGDVMSELLDVFASWANGLESAALIASGSKRRRLVPLRTQLSRVCLAEVVVAADRGSHAIAPFGKTSEHIMQPSNAYKWLIGILCLAIVAVAVLNGAKVINFQPNLTQKAVDLAATLSVVVVLVERFPRGYQQYLVRHRAGKERDGGPHAEDDRKHRTQ